MSPSRREQQEARRAALNAENLPRSSPELAYALELFDAGRWQDHDDEAYQVIKKILFERHPEVAAAYKAWREDPGMKRAGEIIAAAVRQLGRRYVWLENNRLTVGSLGEYGAAWVRAAYSEETLALSMTLKTWEPEVFTVEVEVLDFDTHRFTAGQDEYVHRTLPPGQFSE